METIIKIDGMMCPHCEARVKKVLEELDELVLVVLLGAVIKSPKR